MCYACSVGKGISIVNSNFDLPPSPKTTGRPLYNLAPGVGVSPMLIFLKLSVRLKPRVF